MSLDRCVRWRGTPHWEAAASTVTDLARAGVVQFADGEAADRLVGELCTRLDGFGLLAGTRRAAVQGALAAHGWATHPFVDSLALELCALADRGGDAAGLAAHLERFAAETPSQLWPDPHATSPPAATAAAVLAAYAQPQVD